MIEIDSFLETEEYLPLPYYVWDRRPVTVPLDFDEVKTAFALAHGDPAGASLLLKVSIVRLRRWVRSNPRIVSYIHELAEAALEVGLYEPVRAIFDSGSDARRREWASTKLAQSRLAMGHMLSPAPASSMQSSAQLTLSDGPRRIIFKWQGEEDGSPVVD